MMEHLYALCIACPNLNLLTKAGACRVIEEVQVLLVLAVLS